MAKVRLIAGGLVLPFRIAPYGEGDDLPVLAGELVPMTREERDEYVDSLSGKRPGQKVALLAAEIARRVVKWDADGIDPKNVEQVKLVPPVFLDRIENHLTGYAVSPGAAADLGKSSPPPA